MKYRKKSTSEWAVRLNVLTDEWAHLAQNIENLHKDSPASKAIRICIRNVCNLMDDMRVNQPPNQGQT